MLVNGACLSRLYRIRKDLFAVKVYAHRCTDTRLLWDIFSLCDYQCSWESFEALLLWFGSVRVRECGCIVDLMLQGISTLYTCTQCIHSYATLKVAQIWAPDVRDSAENWAFLWYSHKWFVQKLWVPRGVFFGFVFSWCLIFICSFVLLFLFFKNKKSSPPAICPGLDDVAPVIWNIWTLRSISVTRKPQLNRLICPTRAWLLSANGSIFRKWESGPRCVTQHSRK